MKVRRASWGLRPVRIHLLVEAIEQTVHRRNIQVIATTHSPQVLLSLSDQALRDAVVFGRTQDTVGTVMRRIRDLPHFEEISKRRSIDELFTTGWLERAL